MKHLYVFSLLLFILINLPSTLWAQKYIHHEMKVVLQPEKRLIEVEDTVTFPESRSGNGIRELTFVLHRGLRPVSANKELKITSIEDKGTAPGPEISNNSQPPNKKTIMEHYRVLLPAGKRSFTIKYKGEIYHPLKQQMEERDRSFKETPGLISSDGIFLGGPTYWYPWFDDELMTFSMEVQVPKGWNVISQGERTMYKKEGNWVQVGWESKAPQDEIYLVGGKFTEYSRKAGPISTLVFLRNPDEKLANKYLDTAARYLEMYSKLLGTYPYKKFALVENFWETGYGMPSFALLGPKIIRFPFILHSSFPHEILHNWWGNSVFADVTTGNWSEGLTAYLSDHLIKEQRGQGVDYRRDTLQRYTDYVAREKDFPIVEFRSRHSPVTEAVGYGKTLMFFHMLRLQLGDEVFIRSLQKFNRKNKFRFATFENIREAFASVSGNDLKPEFNQWIKRTGAPELQIHSAVALKDGKGYRLTAVLEQKQTERAYILRVPIAVYFKDHKKAYQKTVLMNSKRLELSLNVPFLPLRLDIDPEFDLFRRLDRDEIPPALSQAYGSDKVLIILPAEADKDIQKGYRKFAESMQGTPNKQVDIIFDNEIDGLPDNRTLWILGQENRFRSKFIEALSAYNVSTHDTGLIIKGNEIKRKNHSIVLTARHPANPDSALVWVAVDNIEAIPGLARKLPHYGRYSYLAFEGKEPSIVFKGKWPAISSPMSILIEQQSKVSVIKQEGIKKLASRTALATLPDLFSKDRMLNIIRFLTKDDMRGRGFGSPELEKAADFIAKKFDEAGLQPAGSKKGSYFQVWEERGGVPEREVVFKNIVGIIPGTNPDWAAQSVVIGAHYDHLGLGWPDVRKGNKGEIHPGADDNASGVAILLELAQLLGKKWKPERTVVFVAFTGEEAGRIGSEHYIKDEKRFPTNKIMGMLNLDTVGRLGKKKLTIFGTGSAREWVHIFMGAGYVTGVKIESVAKDFGSSDQKSFLEAGVPAVQFFSGPNLDYHSPTDTFDKIDSDGLVKAASVAKEAIEYLAGREQPLSSMLSSQNEYTTKRTKNSSLLRKVSLGTIPDFAYTGKGVRIAGISPNSPVEKAELQKGDIITLLNSTPVDDLHSFSNFLKKLRPGDIVAITFTREGKEKTVRTKAAHR